METGKLKLISYIAIIGFLWVMTGCNASTATPEEGDYGNVSITSFSIKANDKILPNLDSVYFSIDLVSGRVFNADSLPAGTDVSHLIVQIGTPEVNECKITYRLPGTLNDTTISHIGSPNDSINFAGPVSVEITSLNRQNKRIYSLEVNVHRSHPDSLVWSGEAEKPLPLPTNLGGITGSKTINMQGRAVCLTSDGAKACIATSQSLEANIWEEKAVTLPAGARVESFNSLGQDVYILEGTGELNVSHDMGGTWEKTGAIFNYIYGSTGDKLVGNVKDENGDYWHVSYPASVKSRVPEECPVEGTGDLVNLVSIWGEAPVSIFLGGKKGDGSLSGETWGYDGYSWTRISQGGVKPMEGLSLIPYFTFKVNTQMWKATKESIMLAFGGRDATGEVQKGILVSYDCGIHWQPADSLLNVPEFIPAFYQAQALIFDSLISSRVTKPITEWECPYIYLFGGKDSAGKALATRWRGVVSRLSFKPLY